MGKLYDIHFKNTTEASLSRGWLGDGGGLPVPVGAVTGFGFGLCQNLIKKEPILSKHLAGSVGTLNRPGGGVGGEPGPGGVEHGQ